MSAPTPRLWREVGVLAISLTFLAILVYGPNVLHSGFLSDAWSNRSLYRFSPDQSFFGEISNYFHGDNFAVRPLYTIYLVLLNTVFGSHMHFWLGWLVATNVLMCVCLYVLLRQLSFAPIDAGVVVALVLLFPAVTSLRFWAATMQAPVAIGLALAGFSVAFVAFNRTGRTRLALHAVSLTLFAASLLLYEVALPFMLSSVLLYRLRVGWREATRRWLADCAVLLVLIFTVTRSRPSNDTQGITGMWHHGKMIASEAKDLFLTVVLPFASSHWYILLLVALVPVAALVVVRATAAEDATHGALGCWLGRLAAGIAVVVFGYAIYVPAIDYYVPMGPGIADRVNAVPSIGFALIVYSGAMLAGTLALRDTSRRSTLTTAFAISLAALLAVGWVDRVTTDSDAYRRAFAEDERVLSTVRSALPNPPPNSTIWTFGQPVEVEPGIPVFGNTWDMTGSVQLTYTDPTLRSYVAFPETTFDCRAQMVVPGGNPTYAVEGEPRDNPYASPYGLTFFIDTDSGEVRAINSRAACLAARREFPLSPALPTA